MTSDKELEPNTKTYELPDKPIVPATYPDLHGEKSQIPLSSENNVEYSKEWVDHNIK